MKKIIYLLLVSLFVLSCSSNFDEMIGTYYYKDNVSDIEIELTIEKDKTWKATIKKGRVTNSQFVKKFQGKAWDYEYFDGIVKGKKLYDEDGVMVLGRINNYRVYFNNHVLKKRY